jgi:hypothetical protein
MSEAHSDRRTHAARTHSGMRCAHLAWITWLGLWSLPAASAAAEKPSASIQLRYTAPPDCPDRDYVLRAIDSLVDASGNLDHTLDVTARVELASDGEYALNLRWHSDSGTGQRSIEAESCQAAADAASWLIALAINRPAPATGTEKRDPSSHVLHYELGVNAASAFGVLPGVAWGGNLQAGIAWSALHADLAFGFFPGKEITRNGATVNLRLAEVSLRACYLVANRDFGVGPCARATLGQIAATSRGLSAPSHGDERFQMLALGVHLRARLLDSLWVMTDAELAWHQRRPIFVISGPSVLYQPRSVGLRLGLGFALVL